MLKHRMFVELTGHVFFLLILQIYAGPDKAGPRLAQLCHDHLPTSGQVITIPGNNAYVHFATDFSISGRGFSIQYTAVDGGEFFQLFFFEKKKGNELREGKNNCIYQNNNFTSYKCSNFPFFTSHCSGSA